MYGGRSGRAKGKAPKSKKLKCTLCDAKGHDATSCPHQKIQEQLQKDHLMKPTLGFGKTHKTSRKAGSIMMKSSTYDSTTTSDTNLNGSINDPLLDIVSLFSKHDDDTSSSNSSNYQPLYIYDTGCNIDTTIETIASLYGSLKKAKSISRKLKTIPQRKLRF